MRNSVTNSDGDSNCDSYSNGNGHSDPDSHGHANSYCNVYGYCDSDSDSYGYSYFDAETYAYGKACTHSKAASDTSAAPVAATASDSAGLDTLAAVMVCISLPLTGSIAVIALV